MALDLILRELWPFELSNFRRISRLWILSLCYQLLAQFSLDVSQTLQTYCEHVENVYVDFGLR